MLRDSLYACYKKIPLRLRRGLFERVVVFFAPRPDRYPPPSPGGVVVVGEFQNANGVGRGARLMSEVLRGKGIPVWEIDASALVPGGKNRGLGCFSCPEVPPPGVPMIFHINPPVLPWVMSRLPPDLTKGRRIIGYWVWDLPIIPSIWRLSFRFIHEVWTPSNFSAEAIRKEFQGPLRVVPHPLGALPPISAPRRRADFGLPEDRFIVLASFSLASSYVRKNPEAAIAAFRAAFGDKQDCLLLLKVSHHTQFPSDFEILKSRVQGFQNIVLETRILSRADTDALTEMCDVFLSLHRSEGFGLIPAEALLLGTPVVSTDWSATSEFVTPETGFPIPYSLVPAIDPRGVYQLPGAHWAEADTAAAAKALRFLKSSPSDRRSRRIENTRILNEKIGSAPLLRALQSLEYPHCSSLPA